MAQPTNMDKLCESAAEFNVQLQALAEAVDRDISQVVRGSVLRLYSKIIQISPVDTGTYRASHDIANHEPGDNEGIVKSPHKPSQGEAKTAQAEQKSWADAQQVKKKKAWTWRPGDGSIWIFNNVPYAVPLEEGHSKQAAAGIYNVALSGMAGYMAEEIAKTTTITGMGE